MKSFLLTWMLWNAVLGSALLIVGCAVAAMIKSPVRRLRLLEWTLVTVLAAPLLASAPLPWQWSLRWLPPEPQLPIKVASALERPSDVAPRSAGALVSPRVSPNAQALRVNSERVASAPMSVVAPPREWSGWLDVLLLVQGAVIFLLAGWWLLGTIALRRLWSRARLEEVHLGHFPTDISSKIEVRSHPQVLTPCAFGLRRRCILLPAQMVASHSEQSLRFAFAHEWSHLHRGDLWTWRLTRFAQAALWFQPAYWWLRWQVRLCQDYLADADAAQYGARADFAAFLVDSARTQQALLAGAALPLSSRASDLSRRIAMLLHSHAPLESRCPRWIQAAAALVVVMLLTAAAVVRLEAQEAVQSKGQAAAQSQTTDKAITYRCRVVTYETSAPIAGAKVTVRRELVGDPRYGVSKILETTEHTTDADGYYSFTLPPEQVAEHYLYIELDVLHPDHATKKGFGYSMTMIRRNEQMRGRPFFETTKLQPAKAVTGRLLTPDGQPAAHVPIIGYTHPEGDRFSDEDMRGSFFEAVTDDAGRFRVAITTPGKGAFWFKPANFAPLGVVAPVTRGDMGNIQLKDGLRTKGRLFDADGKPVGGVQIRTSRHDGESTEVDQFNNTSMAVGGYSRESMTDAEGRFEVAPVGAGTYEFRIDKDRHSDSSPKYAGTFLNHRVSITKDGQKIEFRAVPTVAIRVQNVDASGKPKRGFEFHVSGHLREESKDWFHTMSDRPVSGLCTARVPKGLQDVQIQFSDNEHGSFRVRRSAGAKPEAIREIKLDRVDADLEGIEVVRYKAPIILLKAVDAAGNAITDFKPSAHFRELGSTSKESELRFEKQEDGRWRSMMLCPDMETTVSAVKPGWKAESRRVTLAEGAEEEVVLVMTK